MGSLLKSAHDLHHLKTITEDFGQIYGYVRVDSLKLSSPDNELYHVVEMDSSNQEDESSGRTRSRQIRVSSIPRINNKLLSVVAVFTYVVVLAVVAMFQAAAHDGIGSSHKIPSQFSSRYTLDAWSDLQYISQAPHSYGNVANDDVHAYLLKAIHDASENSSIEFQVDAARQQLFLSEDSKRPIYYESNNVLVKIPGSHPNLSNILVSAHFDSVPTGKGTTDDGMGIASMLAILRYFLDQEKPPTRSIVFNFNNNEEFGLLGARAFLAHEWSKHIGGFLNLEGAGAGGRPVLFRATDLGMAQQFAAASNPHGSSLLQQGFESKLVASDTDYSVYVRQGGMRGLDLAFYKPRSLYHTRRDNIQSSSPRSLGLMFTNALEITRSMCEFTRDEFPSASTRPVYFDLFGKFFFAYSLGLFFWSNVLGLIIGPVVVWYSAGQPRELRAFTHSYSRSLLSLVASAATAGVYLYAVQLLNPFVLVSEFYIPLLSAGFIFIVVNWLILRLTSYFKPSVSQKLDMYVIIWAVLWILLLGSTIAMSRFKAIGYYLLTYMYYGSLVGVIIGSVVPPAVTRNLLAVSENPESTQEEGAVGETTRLLPHISSRSAYREDSEPENDHSSLIIDLLWLIEFIVVVPIILMLVSTTVFVAVDSMHQSTIDSASYSSVFALFQSITVAAIMIFLFALPFTHVLHGNLVTVLTVGAILGSLSSFMAPAYTYKNPLKLRFVQRVDLQNGNSSVTALGSTESTIRSVLKDLPSIKHGHHPIICNSLDGRSQCNYIGLDPFVGGSKNYNDWITYNYSSDIAANAWGLSKSTLTVQAKGTRRCDIAFFDEDGQPSDAVKAITVYYGNNHTITARYHNGYDSMQIHKLNWEDPYKIDLEWLPSWQEENQKLTAELTCMYAEYDQEIQLPDGQSKRMVPALDELLEYSPNWITWVNSGPGLVQAKVRVQL